jgi:peptidoglycan/LPS O-acetylase OafA/YrhL
VARISRPRLHALDGLRGLAALAVVVLHVWMYTDANFPRPGRTDLLDRTIGELRIAVVLFFVLSGFLLAQPWVRGRAPHLGRYAVRRFARIAPAYWAAVLGSLLILHGTGHGRDIDLHDLPKFMFFVANVFPETRNQLDPPLWSLHIEVSFYVVLPLIGLALLRAKRPLLVCLALIAAGLAWATAGTVHAWPPEATWTLPSYVGAFAAGIAAATLPSRPRLALATVAAGTVAVVANAVWHSGGTGTLGHAVGDLPAALGFAAIIHGIAARPGRLLSSAPLRALGTLSFGIYLWHMPVLYLLQIHARFPERFLPALAWVLPGTFLAAIASWFLIEKPAIALSGRALARPTAREVPAIAER